MKRFLIAAVAAAGVAMGSASAGTISFADEADTNGERGVADFSVLNIGGVNVRLAAGTMQADGFVLVDTGDDVVPYLDHSIGGDPGGLGVCRLLDDNDQCADSSDDSIDGDIGFNEAINIFFPDGPLNLTSISFWDGDHNSLADSTGLVNYTIGFGDGSNTGFQTATFADLVALFIAGIDNVTFLNFGFNNTEFYVAALEFSEVPIPGALPLLLSGIAGLGFASRRKKQAA